MKANGDRILPSPRRRPGSNATAGVTGADQAVPAAPAVKVAAAPRQFQTRWMIAVAGLVLVGGLAVLYALPQYTRHETVVVMARDVKMGQTITSADVMPADVSVGEPAGGGPTRRPDLGPDRVDRLVQGQHPQPGSGGGWVARAGSRSGPGPGSAEAGPASDPGADPGSVGAGGSGAAGPDLAGRGCADPAGPVYREGVLSGRP